MEPFKQGEGLNRWAEKMRAEGVDRKSRTQVVRDRLEDDRIRERAERVQMVEVTSGMVEAFQRATRAPVLPDDVVLTGLTVAMFSRYLEEAKTVTLHPINLDPYPATIGELADEFVRAVVDLEKSGVARGIVGQIIDKLRSAYLHASDGWAEQESNRNGEPF